MKKTLHSLLITAFAGGIILLSCKKGSDDNKPPIANAGIDTIINLPTNSTLLDGSKSGDPDGKISAWKWTKISGPALFYNHQPLLQAIGIRLI